MSEKMWETLGMWGYVLIPFIVGVISSIATEFVYQITPEWLKRRLSSYLVILLFTVLTVWAFDTYYVGVKQWLLAGFTNWIVAYAFYTVLKTRIRKIVTKIVNLGTKRLESEIEND